MVGLKNDPEIKSLNPINQKAAIALGSLHEKIKATGYTGHDLEVLLVRLLFCLFAQCTDIFDREKFTALIQNTREDGSDTGSRIVALFETLNTEYRQTTLDDELASFRYVNGNLFKENIRTVHFNREMRKSLLDCCKIDWSEISPAIFGTLFQSIMDEDSRHALGAHYTSEENILKLINPLFMDELRTEFEKVKKSKQQLNAFHDKLCSITFLDPACGCGNFLVVAYRELRELELEVIKIKDTSGQLKLDIHFEVKVDVNQCYGIEIEEWPAQIARVALWLTDHQMNRKVKNELALRHAFDRIPLKTSPNIKHDNALTVSWEELVPNCSYILGNPPFLGYSLMNLSQKHDTTTILGHIHQYGLLDYVCCWFIKAAHYMQTSSMTRTAFVATNSLSQGEQVGILWKYLLNQKMYIHFAHRTFQWNNEAKGKAAVHCVIIGFGLYPSKKPMIFEYASPKSKPHVISVTHINPYLIEGPNILLERRKAPLMDAPVMTQGSAPLDGGNLILNTEEYQEIVTKEPKLLLYTKKFVSSEDFIWNKPRYCFWLQDCPPEILRLPILKKRLDQVRQFRSKSARRATYKLASTPAKWERTQHPNSSYLLVPRISSEMRTYIPIGFMHEDVVASDACLIITNATLYHFGVLSSAMHMAWVRTVCGRLENRLRYSAEIVYNNFPWPDIKKNHDAIVDAAQHVLNIRQKYVSNSLGELYDPLAMPPDLLDAHTALNRKVDKAYGFRGFPTEAERMSLLFHLYENIMNHEELPKLKNKHDL